MSFDRGSQSELQFRRCERGFMLVAGAGGGDYGTFFAFDKIEDLAAWLVDQYGHPTEPDDSPTQCVS